MNDLVVGSAVAAEAPASELRRLEKLVAVAGAIILIASQFLFADLAAGWAVSGLFGLGSMAMTGIDLVGIAVGLVFVVWFARNALSAEGFID